MSDDLATIPIAGVIATPLAAHRDARGWLVELFRADESGFDGAWRPAMAYVSETAPGVTRGPHEHRDQTDVFAFLGPGDFRIDLWDARAASPTHGVHHRLVLGASQPARLIVPPGVVHAYQNISDHPGWVFNLPNRLYAGWQRREPVDEIRHELDASSPYVVD